MSRVSRKVDIFFFFYDSFYVAVGRFDYFIIVFSLFVGDMIMNEK